MVTGKLICVFVFAYAKSRFSYNAAHIAVLFFFISWLLSKLSTLKIKLYMDLKYRIILRNQLKILTVWLGSRVLPPYEAADGKNKTDSKANSGNADHTAAQSDLCFEKYYLGLHCCLGIFAPKLGSI